MSFPICSCVAFCIYVQTLPAWELSLLSNTEFFHDVVHFTELLSLLSRAVPLLLCSNGSAVTMGSMFGVICYFSPDQKLATLIGPAPGFCTLSFRAKGYAMLALLRLVFCSCEFCGVSLPVHVIIYTDSKSTLQMMAHCLQWVEDYPYSTMTADWDLHHAITHTLQLFPTTPCLEHVKGHQDHGAIESFQLLLLAWMNIEADCLAAAYEYPPDISPTHALLIDGATTLLHGPDGTISSNYCQQLCKLCLDPILQDYLCTRNKWTSKIFQWIQWDLHGQVVRSFYIHCHFLIKFLHGWLPLGHLQQHYATHLSAPCPACSHNDEDWDCFLRCPGMLSWCQGLFDELSHCWQQQCVDPCLQNILLNEMRAWLYQIECKHPSYSTAYHRLVHCQQQVGIVQLFYRQFVADWVQLQEEYLTRTRL